MARELPADAAGAFRRVAVLLPLPLAGTLDYRLSPEQDASLGSIVVVPLGSRDVMGVVWDQICDQDISAERLKPVKAVVETYRFDRVLREFIDWIANYTLSSRGDVLAMALRPAMLQPPRTVWKLAVSPSYDPAATRRSPARQRVIDALSAERLSASDLAQRAEVSPHLIRGMRSAGMLETVAEACAERPAGGRTAEQAASLSPDQAASAAALRATVASRSFSVTLLQGATGSGKTEVYFEALRACLAVGRQVLILLPEIALSTQWLRRFEGQFGFAPGVWHSELGMKARRQTWQAVARNAAPVVVGARSALFLPFQDLGLIVVDEEHDGAFKQEDGVIYHARDMAVVRGRLCEAPVLLVSATPSLETLANVEAGRYAHLNLPVRFGGAAMPKVAAIDLRANAPERGSFLSPILVDAIAETLARGEQAMLFLNRRGYAPLTLCRACGTRIACPNCTSWLVEHRVRRALLCHHCAHTVAIPATCSACGATGSLTPVGPGVERITEEVDTRFPDARRLIMASDTLPGPQAAAAAAELIEQRAVDIIIGTQVVAKGWHFPHLTLVGVVDADLGLSGGDLRAGERTMQMLHQVAGRAGREQHPGRVLLQTYQPEHPLIQALIAGDLAGFMQAEAAQRRPGHWPPYGRLVAVIVSAERAEDADAVGRSLGLAAPSGDGVIVLGPAPAPLAMLRGRHRRRLLLRATRDIAVQPLLRRWLAKVKAPRRVRIDIDVDPISFL